MVGGAVLAVPLSRVYSGLFWGPVLFSLQKQN